MLGPSETELLLTPEQLQAWHVSKRMIVATTAKLVVKEKQEAVQWKVGWGWSVTGSLRMHHTLNT